MRRRHKSPARRGNTRSAAALARRRSGDATPFVTVECPYCGEPFDARLDLSAGAADYIEDCQVCCQPIQFQVEVDTAGDLEAVDVRRTD